MTNTSDLIIGPRIVTAHVTITRIDVGEDVWTLVATSDGRRVLVSPEHVHIMCADGASDVDVLQHIARMLNV